MVHIKKKKNPLKKKGDFAISYSRKIGLLS